MTDIALEHVSYTYPGGVQALAEVDLQIRAGEGVALIGQNGSGKTTLVRHLNGLLRPSSGRVLLGGTDAATLRVAQLARQVGLAFQDPDTQIFSGTVRAEVEFGPRNLGLRGLALRDAVDAALGAVGMADEARTNHYDLGASRRKLLSLAAVLAMQTPVLVLDEPTTGQDRRGVTAVRAVVAAALAAGRTVIAVSHDLRFVAETMPRVVVLRGGRVLADGSPGEVFARSRWPDLRSTGLEPPEAAVIANRLGLGGVATEAELIGAMAART